MAEEENSAEKFKQVQRDLVGMLETGGYVEIRVPLAGGFSVETVFFGATSSGIPVGLFLHSDDLELSELIRQARVAEDVYYRYFASVTETGVGLRRSEIEPDSDTDKIVKLIEAGNHDSSKQSFNADLPPIGDLDFS